jgi:predicted dehydrogenase
MAGKVASGRDLGVGIIGTGISGKTMAQAFGSTQGARVVAMTGRTPARAEKVAARYGAVATRDVESLVSRPDIDLVVVATPHSQHLEGVLAAAQAGKAVLCEKPFALNADHARQMVDAAERAGVRTFVNFEFRRFGGRQRMHELIAEGFVGQVKTAYLFGSSNYLDIAGEYVPRWHLDSAEGGGWLSASATHDVDALRHFVGEIASVCADLSNVVPELVLRGSETPVPSETDDAALLLLRFASGASGVLANTSAAATPTLGQRIEIFGDEGTLILSSQTMSGGPLADQTQLWGARKEEGALRLLHIPAPLVRDDDPHAGPQLQWASEIVAALRTGSALSPSFEDGWQNQLVLDAARLSDAEGRWVTTAEIAQAFA